MRAAHSEDLLSFLESPLAGRMLQEGRLVPSEILSRHPLLQLRHPRIGFVTYPWEWSPSMWMDAADLTLSVCGDLLDQGWLLKDATPLNVLFEGSRPIFVDVLSVARADLRVPIWFAYGQFIRTFLLPMLAHKDLGWPLHTSMLRRDGYEPEEIGAALPWTGRWRQPALTAVTLPLLFSKGKNSRPKGPASRDVDPEAAKYILAKTIDRLRRKMRQVQPAAKTSTWSGYAETAAHYSTGEHEEKRAFVERILSDTHPQWVLDVGSNTGVYSRLASDAGARVVSIDTDLQAVDRLYRSVQGTPHAKTITPLCLDLSRPTPAVGWENRENASFLSRAEGRFPLVLMLAVIHHLLLGSQIPLEHIASLASRLTSKDLILEWVPPSDVKYIEVLRGRDEIYRHITEAALRSAFEEHFLVLEEKTLGNGRILFHMRRRDPLG